MPASASRTKRKAPKRKAKPKPPKLADLGLDLSRPNIATVPVERINPAPYNPRADLQPGDPEYEALTRGIQTYGMVQLLVWNQRTGHLVGGHQSYKVLRQAFEIEQATVAVVDLDEPHEKALNVALNKIGGRWDRNRLDPLLAELQSLPDFDATLTGFDATALARDFEVAAQDIEAATKKDTGDDAPVDDQAELDADLRMEQRSKRQETLHLMHVSNAAKHLDHLPDEDVVVHAIMRGNYNAWDLVPAVLRLIEPQPILQLYVATLSFNRKNAEELAGLVRDGLIRQVVFLCSAYFEKTGGREYQSLQAALRGRRAKLLAARNHAKVLLMRTGAGHHLVLESSANLRSCRNVEQFTLTNSAEVYAFHRGWIDELFRQARKKTSKR